MWTLVAEASSAGQNISVLAFLPQIGLPPKKLPLESWQFSREYWQLGSFEAEQQSLFVERLPHEIEMAFEVFSVVVQLSTLPMQL